MSVPVCMSQKGPRAVCVLGQPRRPAPLPEERRLLVPNDAGKGRLDLQGLPTTHSEVATAQSYFREQGLRHPQEIEKPRVPRRLGQVVEERSGSVGRVRGMHVALGQTSYQPRVDGARRQIARFRSGQPARAAHGGAT